MSSLSSLIGDTVIDGVGGEKRDTSSLAGEGKVTVLGLYFSAHWCGPCRSFTPMLIEFYNKFKAGKNLEIVYVSSDQDESKFQSYYSEMPWLALPFEDRKQKTKLSKKFKVQGIPTLVFVDACTGELITSDGRSSLMQDPEGNNFPWRPKSLADIIQGRLLGPDSQEVDSEKLAGKVLGFYFSAHWCPPCRGFTPKLVDTYNSVKAANKNLEIVFVSSDRAEPSFNEYFAEMPWYSIPYQDPRGAELKTYFGIGGIPSFVIIDESHKVITLNGRAAVFADPEGKDFPWKPKPLEELTEHSAGALNESTCLIYFTDGEAPHIENAKAHMLPVAEEYKAENADGDLVFFYEGESGDIAESLRGFAHLDDTTPQLALLDVPAEQVYIHKGELSTDGIRQVVKQYKDGTIDFTGLKQ